MMAGAIGAVLLLLGVAATTGGARPPARALGPAVLARYSDPGVLSLGQAPFEGSPTATTLDSPAVALVSTPDGLGYWIATAGGGVLAYGDAKGHGTALGAHLAAPVVAMARTADGGGYWLLTAAGGVRAFGDARKLGSWPVLPVVSPDVDLVATPDGLGYWILNSAGGLRAFGDAVDYGDPAPLHPTSRVVAMAATVDGAGYWIVTSVGHIYPYGDAAPLHISARGRYFTQAVTGIATAPSGTGFWLAGQNGQVQSYGQATPYFGSNASASPVQPIAAITAAPDGLGYWLLEPDAFPTAFTSPISGGALGARIVSAASSQIRGDPDPGLFCNPYGPCEPWCALFATWAWRQAGVQIPSYAFVGDMYDWSAQYVRVLRGDARPYPGDAVLYGTGPQDVSTSVHVGIVAQVWKDGFIDTVEGDAGPASSGHFNVVINGPYLPSRTLAENGMPIYGYAVP
jgi:hypothetical protein